MFTILVSSKYCKNSDGLVYYNILYVMVTRKYKGIFTASSDHSILSGLSLPSGISELVIVICRLPSPLARVTRNNSLRSCYVQALCDAATNYIAME